VCGKATSITKRNSHNSVAQASIAAPAIQIGEGVMHEEVARTQDRLEELLQLVANDIAAFRNGGPNLRAAHLRLIDLSGFPEELKGEIDAEWDEAEDQRKAKVEPTKPPLSPWDREMAERRARQEAIERKKEAAKPPEEVKPEAAKLDPANPTSGPNVSGTANPQPQLNLS
jgi:hypothetical protein